MSREAYERVRRALNGTALDGQIERLNTELHLTPDSPEWTIAALGIIGSEKVRTDIASLRLRLKAVEEEIVESMRASAIDIVSGLAADIADKSVEAIKVAVSGEIVQSVLAAKTSLEALATQHATTMTEKANKFGTSAEAAVGRLVVAGTDVRNYAAAITRLHTTHLIVRFGWAFGGFFVGGALLFLVTHFGIDHFSCIATVDHLHAYHSESQRHAWEAALCH